MHRPQLHAPELLKCHDLNGWRPLTYPTPGTVSKPDGSAAMHTLPARQLETGLQVRSWG